MKRIWVALLVLPLYAAGVIPNRYIVELSTEPVAEHVRTMGKAGLRSQRAQQHRARIRGEHQTVRRLVEQEQATVLNSVDTVANALVVQIPDARAARLRNIPGVARVRQARQFHLVLDHALPLHKAPDAWSQVGIENAGAGIKIAIIDTGIDIDHPGFQDPSMSAPHGFPKVNDSSDVSFTNGKVIVARSYASLWARSDPDPSARDHVGHGTATGMAAAGAPNTGPLATISGVAPKAWLGNYKVFGSPGSNDGASEDAILKALDDAVADGMDVISMSLGSDLALRPEDDPEVQALERATALGIVTVVAAGNNGPDPATIASPANAPSAIAVGASANDRVFLGSVKLPDNRLLPAIPGSGRQPSNGITAPLMDVALIDGDGMACAPLSPGSLSGSIALILRGVCTFEQKLNNAQGAGAVAGLIYTDESRPDPIPMSVGNATLPAVMIGYQDGVSLKQQLGNRLTATLQFTPTPFYRDPDRLTDFTAKGPDPAGGLKPDLVAVGANMYTAAQRADSRGVIYDPSGYSVEAGTSFSAPLVAGAAALLKAARPGLTAAQYRSLLINSATPVSLSPGVPARVQQAGAGLLDVSAALRSTATVSPVSVSFGSGGSAVDFKRDLVLSNIGTAAETYFLSVIPRDGTAAPWLPSDSVQLEAGASAHLALTFAGSGLQPGQYEGVVVIQGVNSGVQTRVPYWYAITTGVPQYITVLDTRDGQSAGATVRDAILFHIADAAGLTLDTEPVVEVLSGGGSVQRLRWAPDIAPGVFTLSVRLGSRIGANTFRIQAGDITRDVTLTGH